MATETMTYTPAAIENGIPGYFEIRNSDGMNIGNAITNNSPFEGCQPVTIEDAERNANLWCAAPGLLEALEESLEAVEELNGEFQEGWEPTIEKIKTIMKKAKGL